MFTVLKYANDNTESINRAKSLLINIPDLLS